PGSGDSHDPAPVHHPHPARSPPAVASWPRGRAGAYGAVPPPSTVLRLADAPRLPPALDPPASTTPGTATKGQAHSSLPPTHPAHPQGQDATASQRSPRSPVPPQHTATPKTGHQQDKPQHHASKRPRNPRVVDRSFHMNIHVLGVSAC